MHQNTTRQSGPDRNRCLRCAHQRRRDTLTILSRHDRQRIPHLQRRHAFTDGFEATCTDGEFSGVHLRERREEESGARKRAVRNVKVGVIIRAGSKIIVIGYLTVGAAVEVVH